MNNIDLKLNDIEGINFSLDVAVKKIEPPLEDLEVIPTKEQQTFNHENSYGYDNVVINPIPDEYIIPDGTLPITENTTYDVRRFARVSASVHPAPNLQDKELTINENGTHKITADDEFDGLNEVSVTVDAIENLTEELNVYNEELTEQEDKIANIINLLKDKATPDVEKYAPRYISFNGYTGTELDYELANLDTSNMTSLNSMFSSCRNLTSLVLENLNTSNVTSVNYLFNYCKSLTSVVLRNLDISNVTSTYSMFASCSVLNSVVFDNTDTSKITNMQNMFNGCDTTTSLDLSTLETNSVTDMYGMFSGCSSLQILDIRKFDFSNVTKYGSMFLGVPSNCVIIVKDDTARRWIRSVTPNFTIKTVADLEG